MTRRNLFLPCFGSFCLTLVYKLTQAKKVDTSVQEKQHFWNNGWVKTRLCFAPTTSLLSKIKHQAGVWDQKRGCRSKGPIFLWPPFLLPTFPLQISIKNFFLLPALVASVLLLPSLPPSASPSSRALPCHGRQSWLSASYCTPAICGPP